MEKVYCQCGWEGIEDELEMDELEGEPVYCPVCGSADIEEDIEEEQWFDDFD